jgi:hypothetical protein
MHKQLARYLPEGRKNPASPVQLPCPPVLARHAVFLFLRRPTEEFSSEEQETLALLRSLHRCRWIRRIHWFSSSQTCCERAPENSSTTGFHQSEPARTAQLQGFVLSVVRDKAAVVAGLTLPQNNGLVEGKVNKLKRDLTHDVWPGRISLVASTSPACFVAYLKGPVLSQ